MAGTLSQFTAPFRVPRGAVGGTGCRSGFLLGPEVVSKRLQFVELTQDWEPEEREAFCALLTRFNTALSARMTAQGVPGPEASSPS